MPLFRGFFPDRYVLTIPFWELKGTIFIYGKSDKFDGNKTNNLRKKIMQILTWEFSERIFGCKFYVKLEIHFGRHLRALRKFFRPSSYKMAIVPSQVMLWV